MLFSSMVFVFLFLPLTCFAYLCVNTRLKNYVLLIASLIFYAWGEPRYLAIMLLTIGEQLPLQVFRSSASFV